MFNHTPLYRLVALLICTLCAICVPRAAATNCIPTVGARVSACEARNCDYLPAADRGACLLGCFEAIGFSLSGNFQVGVSSF